MRDLLNLFDNLTESRGLSARDPGEVYSRGDTADDKIEFQSLTFYPKVGSYATPEATMAAFKKVDKKSAIDSTKTLIKRCKDDLTKGYWDIKSKKIAIKVKSEFVEDELVPRYIAEYKVTIKGGEVVIRVETAGVTAEVNTNSKKCKAATEEQVQDQVMKEIVLSAMR